MGEFREWLLDTQTTGDMIKRASRGLTSEMVAAVCKLMGNLDLVYAAKLSFMGPSRSDEEGHAE